MNFTGWNKHLDIIGGCFSQEQIPQLIEGINGGILFHDINSTDEFKQYVEQEVAPAPAPLLKMPYGNGDGDGDGDGEGEGD